jgi:crotonobetainyl-CoA:carnitine CoA-transferase CaiB-like acyl-CoA transferase
MDQNSTTTSAGPLNGIRVLEICAGLAGPSAGRMLGGLGADVIKVEAVSTGDFTRKVVPWVFRSHNRDKRSVAVDLTTDRGRDIVRKLAAGSDVLLQSQRPGFLAEMGLGRDVIADLNPRLIYASLTGFGSTGPDSRRRGVDMLVQAETGMGFAQSGLIGNLSFIDAAAGLSLVTGILAALRERDNGGTVRNVDVSLVDTALYLQAAPFAEFSATGVAIDQVSYWERYATVGVFQAGDGPMYLGAYWDRDWEAICDLIGRHDLLTEPRFATAALRSENSAEIREILEEGFSSWDRDKLVAEFERRGVMVGVQRGFAETLAWGQVKVNGSFIEERQEAGPTVKFAQPPYRLGGLNTESKPSPLAGDGTDAVLSDLGLTADEIESLVTDRVVSRPPT